MSDSDRVENSKDIHRELGIGLHRYIQIISPLDLEIDEHAVASKLQVTRVLFRSRYPSNKVEIQGVPVTAPSAKKQSFHFTCDVSTLLTVNIVVVDKK